MTENLLQSADGTKLRIIIILLPPSEAGRKGNFDWNGWIEYLNSLKAKYPTSLDGFVIDDFNLAKDSAHANKGKGNNDNSIMVIIMPKTATMRTIKLQKKMLILCLNLNLMKH